MDFKNLFELKERLSPALVKREEDLKILGINKTADEIWEDLKVHKWKMDINLSLAEMTDDILKYLPRWDSEEDEK